MDPELERRVRKRVKAKKGFLAHATTYAAVIGFLFFINLTTGDPGDGWWFIYPAASWGVGLFFHYFGAFGFPGADRMVERWEQQELEREMRRREGKKGDQPKLPGASKGLDMDEHLQLREIEKRENKAYDEEDLV